MKYNDQLLTKAGVLISFTIKFKDMANHENETPCVGTQESGNIFASDQTPCQDTGIAGCPCPVIGDTNNVNGLGGQPVGTPSVGVEIGRAHV